MRLQVAAELVVALLLSLQVGCAAPAGSSDNDLGRCTPVGETVDESTNQRYTVLACDSGAFILLPYNECRDNPDSNCKEA